MARTELQAVVTLDDRASSGLSKLGGVAKGLGTAVAGMAIGGFAAATAAIGATGIAAVNVASNFQQSRISFETMLGSGKKAGELLTQISDFARKTPFDLPQVIEGSKKLLAYNIEAEKIIPTFNALGNIAAGVGKEKLPFLTLAFGQVRAAGKLTGQELRQFTEAGVPMLDVLAKQFGTTTASVKKMIEDGKIGFPDVEKAIFGMSQEGGKFFNLMENQSKTFDGTLSNLRDGMFRFALALVGVSVTGEVQAGGMFDKLSGLAQGLLKWVGDNEVALTALSNTIGGVVVTNFTILGNFISQNLQPSLEKTQGFIQAYVAPAFATIASVVETELIPTLQRFWKEHGPEVTKILTIIAGVIGGVTFGAILMLIHAFDGLVLVFGRVLAGLHQIYDFIGGNALISRIQNIAGAVGGFLSKSAGAMGGIPGRAVGGPVQAGRPYIVGEQGPELFVPGHSGSIVPNGKVGSGIQINMNGPIAMNSQDNIRQLARELARQINMSEAGAF